jgi:serine/threonine protein kinase
VQEVQAILPNGTVVHNRYVIEGLLGKGGFGAVYLVRDTRVRGNLYALKEAISPGRSERERFIFEGEVLKRLDHPALPRVYRTFENEQQTRAYILMDYIEGPNLEALRRQQPDKRFSLAQVLAMLSPIAEAITYLHEQRPPVVHRDIKPANMIISLSLNESVLVDFGIAKEQESDATTTAIRHASPGYAAPEQYSRGTTTRTDIYGLAATVYTLLTGTVPADALYRMTELGSAGVDPLVPVNMLNPEISPGVAAVIQRALSLNSNERYASVRDFWQALKEQQAAAIPVEHSESQGPLLMLSPEHLPAPLTTGQKDTFATEPTVHVYKLPSRSRRVLFPLLLVFLLLFATGAALFLAFGPAHKTTPPVVASPVAHHAPTPTPTPTFTPTPTPTFTPTPTPSPSPTPTPVPPGYPSLVASYNGTIHNTPANVTSTMSLTSVRQNGSAISGYFTVGPGLLGSGPFSGTVTTGGSITFLVQAYSNHLPLYFYGTVFTNGSMSGSYCSWQYNRCNNAAGGYGTWKVMPASAEVTPFFPVAVIEQEIARKDIFFPLARR